MKTPVLYAFLFRAVQNGIRFCSTAVAITIVAFIFVQCGDDDGETPAVVVPTITGFSPESGVAGTAVTITGTNFSNTPAGNIVKFNGTLSEVSESTTTTLKVTVPDGTTQGKITVQVGDQTATSEKDFIPVETTLSITGFDPEGGVVGSFVTITGTAFETSDGFNNNIVKFNGIPAEINGYSVSGTMLTVIVPSGAKPGKITVQVGNQIATSEKDFLVPTGIWTQKTNLTGSARTDAVAFSIGDKGYLGTGNGLSDFWEYNPATDTWTQKANIANGRWGAVAFSIGNKGYLGTGAISAVGGPVSILPYKDFWEYNPATNAWTQKANMPTSRYYAVGFGTDTKGYVGMGRSLISHDGGNTFTTTANQDFWEYNPVANTWTQKADFGGGARYSAPSFSIQNKGYVAAGYDVGGRIKLDFWEYDPAKDVWTQKTDYPQGLASAGTGFVINGKGYIVSEYNGDKHTSWVYEYDPGTGTWTPKTNIDENRRGHGTGFSIGAKGYVATGYISVTTGPNSSASYPTSDLWEFDPEN